MGAAPVLCPASCFFRLRGSPAVRGDRVDGAEARRWRLRGYSLVGDPKCSAVGSEVGSTVGSAVGSEKTTVYAGDTTNTQAPRLREARRQCSLKTPQGRARRRPRRQPGPGHRRHGQQGRPRVDLRRREGGLRDDVHGDQRAFVCSRRPLGSNAPLLASGPTRHREKLRADGVEVDVQSPP